MSEQSSSKEVAEFIIEQSLNSQEILGSILGGAIRKRFPSLDFRKVFGSLRSFIENNCGGQVRWIGKHPKGTATGNDVYSHVRWINSGETLPVDTVPYNPWQVFIYLNSQYQVGFNIQTGDLIVDRDEAELPDNFVKIPNASASEHKEIAANFLHNLEGDTLIEFQKSFDSSNYWREWQVSLNKHREDGLYLNWVKWKTDSLFNLFVDRLSSLAISEDVKQNAIKNIKNIQAKRVNKQPVLTNDRERKEQISIDIVKKSELRHLIHRVVDRLSEEELRRVWLPVGVIIDIISDKQK